jgi:hypothetical protein
MNEKSIKKIFKIHWAWNDDKEERWLEKMSREGWHLTSPGFVYRFEKGEPADMVYRMDFQSLRKTDIKEYLGLFKDAGWEHVGRFGAWYYFRTKASGGQVPEIHTDYESRIAKYQRVMYLLVIFFAVIWSQVLTTLNQHRDPHAFWYAVKAVQIIISILMGYAVARLFLKINKIKKEFRVNREKEGDT